MSGMDNFLLVLFISFLLNTTCGVEHSKYTLLVERDISVQRGLCVYIPCRFTVEKGPPTAAAFGTWYKGDSNGEVVSSQNPSVKPPKNPGRIFFTGDATKLDCSMSINDVQDSDGDTPYLFRLEDDGEGGVTYNYVEYKIKLTVTELTEKPVITPVMPLLAGKEVTMTCESPGRCNGSAPLISWEIGGVMRRSVSYQTIHPDGNKTYYSNITFTPSKQDHQSPLTCIVNFQSSSASTRKEIILNVEYPPNVSIIIKDNIQNENTPIIVNEGDLEDIKCTVDSNPKSTIIWTREDKTLPGTLIGQTLIYSVKNANPNDTGIYRCSANNSHSSITRSVNVTVHYAPRTPQISCSMSTESDCAIDEDNTIYVQEGSSLSLRCFAKSSPEAEITWQISRNPNNTSPTGKIDLHDTSTRDHGLYTCKARNVLGASSTSLAVKMISKPKTVSESKSYCKITENHMECTCMVQSLPEAKIQWKIDDKFYDSSDKGIQISTSRSDLVTNSTLSLQMSQKDIPNIKCRSFNKYGELVLDLLYKTSCRSADYKLIVGMVTGNLIILLLIAFGVFWYTKSQKKEKLEYNDTYELSGAKGTDSVYQDLQKPTSSIYQTVIRSQQ